MLGKQFLILAATANFGIALLHTIIPFFGAPAYIYFGAAELAVADMQGSSIPVIMTWGLALVFAGFGFYLLAGAGIIRRLPLLIPALLFIAGIYTFRGLILILDIQRFLNGVIYPMRQAAFSAAALVVGAMVLIGTSLKWKTLLGK